MKTMEVKSIAEQLLFTTIMIEVKEVDGRLSGGTGFFFECWRNNKHYIFIVTCKHVVRDAKEIYLYFLKGVRGSPLLGEAYKVVFINAQETWFGHPDKNIDIAILPFAPVYNKAQKDNVELFFKAVPEKVIARGDILKKLDAIENVIFVGYPAGLWDKKHLIPIVRQGITATPTQLDFNGLKVFLVSAPVFPGSSGSPVFLYDISGTYIDKVTRTVVAGSRFYFLGVISSVFTMHDYGQIIFQTELKPYVQYKQFVDLGIVYKAETIIETIEALLKERGEL